jgi:hypothetical protein
MYWVMACVRCHGKIGGFVYNSLDNVRKRRSKREIKEKRKRWNNLRQRYGFREGNPDKPDPDHGAV